MKRETGVIMQINQLSESQKQKITDWVEEHRHFENNELVTVDYTKDDGIMFANGEWGGVPLKVTGVTWRSVTRITETGLHHIKEANDEWRLVHVFNESGIPDESQNTEYVTTIPCYTLKVAIKGLEDPPLVDENALVRWNQYDGELQFSTRDSQTTTVLKDGEECEICGCEKEKRYHWSNGIVSSGQIECAACGNIKERHSP